MSKPDSPAGRAPTAAVLIIGDEILSGRTRDTNLAMIAQWLTPLGVTVAEARVVPDEKAEIVAALNALRTRHDYVFTTGGIGPTHDDITADAVAVAFGVGIGEHPEALARLRAQYDEPGQLTPARRRMARIPDGATLIENPVSAAPGFQIENVFVLAGVPMIAEAMVKGLADRIMGGAPVESRSVIVWMAESAVAEPLGILQQRFPDVAIGSYPFLKGQRFGTNIVLRSRDRAALEAAAEAVAAMVETLTSPPSGKP
jgi:molybdenum cofactor synthesis domain-containing protein